MNQLDGTTSSSSVTEVGEFLAALATAMPTKTRDDLIRLLSHSVAAPTHVEIREARLGLMVKLVSEGEIPRVEAYEQARHMSEREWPASATLIVHFGSWTNAAKAAMDLRIGATPNRSTARSPQPWPGKPYSRLEILEAIRQSSEKVGREITQWEYQELRRVERRNAEHQGGPEPRLPSIRAVRRAFGGWPVAELRGSERR